MIKITPELLDELEALEQAATPGKWRVLPPSVGVNENWHVTDALDISVVHCFGFNRAVDEQSERNAALIAASRNALPALIKEVRRLRKKQDDWKKLSPGTKRSFTCAIRRQNAVRELQRVETAELQSRVAELESLLTRLRADNPGGTYFSKWRDKIDRILNKERK